MFSGAFSAVDRSAGYKKACCGRARKCVLFAGEFELLQGTNLMMQTEAGDQGNTEAGVKGLFRNDTDSALNELSGVRHDYQLAAIENVRIVRESTAAIQKNGQSLQELDALMDRLAKHKALIVILSLAAAIALVAPYVAMWITIARLHRFTKA
jgi:hypothetical protein